jgi:DNA-binding NarL/FixJ family response regulator
VAFPLSIVTVAYLFYLGGEHSRLYARELAKEFHRRLEAEKLSADEAMHKAGFTPEERDAALLLIEGKTRTEITRGLRLTAAEADRRINAIRDKISSMGGPDPIAAAADAYKLTRRETDMLRCLRRGMTNAEIAAELFLSEETVKGHVRNLLNKMELSSRNDVALWAEALNTSGGAAK